MFMAKLDLNFLIFGILAICMFNILSLLVGWGISAFPESFRIFFLNTEFIRNPVFVDSFFFIIIYFLSRRKE